MLSLFEQEACCDAALCRFAAHEVFPLLVVASPEPDSLSERRMGSEERRVEIQVIPFNSVHAEALQTAFIVEVAESVAIAESL